MTLAFLQRIAALAPGPLGGRTAARGSTVACALAFVILASGCAVPSSGAAAGAAGNAGAAAEVAEPMRRIQVVNHGLHSGLVVRAADVPGCDWPARCAFADAEYLEVGWGDRAYYQEADPSIWVGLRALLWPTPSALHMAAFNGPAAQRFRSLEVIELEVTARGVGRLVAAISASHERDREGRPIDLGPGQYGPSRFYAAREPFHFFRTCNVWTATMLREAGVAVEPALVLTSDSLFRRLRPLAVPPKQ